MPEMENLQIQLLLREGRLEETSPLYACLAETLRSEGAPCPQPSFVITQLDARQSVFLCRELNTRTRVVCKFFGKRELNAQLCQDLMDHEYRCLQWTRRRGFDQTPFSVVRPLLARHDLDFLLIEEFVPGPDLDFFIAESAHQGVHEHLLSRLDLLSTFFSRLHQATAREFPNNFARACQGFRSILKALSDVEGVDPSILYELSRLCDRWEGSRLMWTLSTSLVHGDATPTNFIYPCQDCVTAIDLERMQRGDPVYDLGLLAAELKHHFALRIQQAEMAEQFITRLYQSYSQGFSDPAGIFLELTHRNRFYMALGELRIARNPWLPSAHRRWLLEEASHCMEEIREVARGPS